jgi:hypothetical protein
MAIVIEDLQMEQLAQQLATVKGVSVSEILRESLFSLANTRGLVVKRQLPLRDRLATLACEVDALPHPAHTDRRSDNDILGYSEHGTW